VQPLMWTYKFTREIARRMPHYRGEPSMLHPAFAQGGPASVVENAEGPVSFDAPRVVYSDEDERALEAFVRANGSWLLPFSVFFYYSFSFVFYSFYSGAS
jgi:alcohol oxidase